MFPEGARSGCMEIRHFKPGMFKFAIDNGCDILPLALNNTHKAWSRNDAPLQPVDPPIPHQTELR